MTTIDRRSLMTAASLPSPAALRAEITTPSAVPAAVERARREVAGVLGGTDDRLLVITGPCSVHDPAAVLAYARRLSELDRRVRGRIRLVMRVYVEKPRSRGGWTGLVGDPHLDDSRDVAGGLRLARRLMVDIAGLALPIACEFLDPVVGLYLADLVAWGAIGARTVQSQVHRQFASGLPFPVGFKNSTAGSVEDAVDAIVVAARGHVRPGITEDGTVGILRSTGNPDGHVVLRGGEHGPNYRSADVARSLDLLSVAGLPRRLIVDASHGNSGKQHRRQRLVVAELARQIAGGQPGLAGVMLESFLLEGRQDLVPGGLEKLRFGQSVTDACLGWDQTVQLIEELAEAAAARNAVYSPAFTGWPVAKKEGTSMEPPLASVLPLARQARGDRSAPTHRRAVSDGPLDPRRAVAIVAALVHRYTGQTNLVIGLGTGAAIDVEIDGATTGAELLAAVDAARPRPAGGPYDAAVVAAGEPAPGRLTLVAGPGRAELLVPGGEFDGAAADQYARHLDRLRQALTAEPGVAVGAAELLTDEERRLILVGWNETDEEVPPLFFHEVIADIAQRAPGSPAVVSPGGMLTYRELDDQSNQLAHRLIRLGAGHGSRIGTCFARGPESLIAQLACFKIGAAAILLDPDFPAERIRFMVEHAGAAAVLTTTPHRHLAGDAPVCCLDDPEWRSEPATPLNVRVTPEDLIHICYTSGSTGVPKAVLARHRAARNLIYSMRTRCGIDRESRGTWLAAPGYGMVEVECFSVLAAGAPVHIPEPSVVASAERLRDWFVAEQITHTLLMKPMAERLWGLEWPEHTALRNIRICGERIQSWPEGLPFHVLNLYGSSEATVVAMCDLTSLGREAGVRGRMERTPPIGRPLPNVRTYVLDGELRPVPPGVVGELAVAGDSLSVGYLAMPEASAEKWVPNPFGPRHHPVLYRTGDLARYWTDGQIEIVGRVDNQVKVRGNRVHPGEIEAVLAELAGVAQAAVLARTDDSGDTRLVAYVEPHPGARPASRELRKALRQRLPSFMVPAAFVVCRLPTTTNGKIDYAALPEPSRARPELDRPYRAPENAVERRLCEIWERTLELDGVGVHDDFYDLGGDSLRAVQVTDLIRDSFGIEMDQDEFFLALFDKSTVEGMAAVLGALRAGMSRSGSGQRAGE